jgi:hypothetical protein
MLSIILSVIFFGAMFLQVLIFFKMYRLVGQLKDKNVRISNWSSYAARKDLKNVINSSNDDYAITKAIELLGYLKKRNWLFFGSAGLIILIFILNGIFKLNI